MTIQYQGVWSLQSAAQLQSTQRWVTDPLYKNTTLLLQADDAANAAQNNTFLDSSSNAFAITRNGGNPGMTQGTFTPFSSQPNAWGNFFDGNGDWLSAATNTAYDCGTGNWTLEAWVYIISESNAYPIICGNANTSYATAGSLAFGNHNTDNAIYNNRFIITGSDSNLRFADPSTHPLNTWIHIAVVRDSATTLKMFRDGVQVASTTISSGYTFNWGLNGFRVGGGNWDGAARSEIHGYISNLRLIKGAAIYTSNFTPSPLPLTTTVSAGTVSILTCQSNRFVDNSSIGTTLTPSGTPSVQAFSPFAPQYQWTSSVIGGSGYFDSSGDYLTSANAGAAANLGTTWTVECWLYPANLTSTGSIVNVNVNTGNQGINIYRNGATITVDNGVTGGTGPSGGTLIANAWQHLAVVADGTNTRIFLNGTQVGSTFAGTVTSGTPTHFWVGSSFTGLGAWGGYIANVRIVKGTAVYTGTFTPPIAPVTTSGPASSYSSTTNVNTTFTSTNTSLLLNFTNAGILDGTMKNNLETVGNAQVSTTVVKYGSGSMYFDGTTNTYLAQNPATTDLYAFGSGDFTIECWLYLISTSSIRTVYDSRASGTASSATPTIYIDAGTIKYYVSGADRITGIALTTNQWYHVVVCRSGTSTRMFINGTQVGSTYSDSTVYINSARRPFIAGDSNSAGANLLNGYIDDLRITKGIARYTANFIPPSVALPRQ